MASGHWTGELFLRHSEAFLPIHETAWARGEEETRDLRALFARFGVPPSGRILDAPCGIGRHATRLASMGFRVVGVDLSPAYIARAKQLATESGMGDRAMYIVGNLRRLSETVPKAEAPFDAALNLWTSLGYYGEEADVLVLEEYATLVRPGGILVLFIVSRDHIVRHHEPQSYEVYGDFVVISQERFDIAASWMRNEWRFFRRRGDDLEHVVTVPITHRVYSLHELIRLLERAGWRVSAFYGGWDRAPVTEDRRKIVLVAHAARD